MTYTGLNIPPADAQTLANGRYARFGAGGLGDSTSVAQAMSSLQVNRPADEFNIVLFEDSGATPVSTPDGQSYQLGEAAAKLFGYESRGGVSEDCAGGNDNWCLPFPSSQIFTTSAATSNKPK